MEPFMMLCTMNCLAAPTKTILLITQLTEPLGYTLQLPWQCVRTLFVLE